MQKFKDPVELRAEITRAFNKKELIDLCFILHLGLEYENFPEPKDDFARELVSFCERSIQVEN